MILQACLNGARPAASHPALPLDPAALAADARKAVKSGANEVHLHVRDAAGAETLEPDAVGRTLAEVRRAIPGTLIGVSTGAWIEGDAETTLRHIGSWSALPDHASVNLNEAAAPQVIDLLRRRGVGIEAGLAGAADAERLLALGLGPGCLRVLIELDREQTFTEAKAAADQILDLLARAPWRKPILLHGFDATVWPMLEHAVRSGYSVRVGLEDGLTLPDGSPAPDNAALVAAARAFIDEAART